MPNWCDNTLYVTGRGDDAAALRSRAITPQSKFDFRAVVPAPDVVDDWRSWSAEHWGTDRLAIDAGWMGLQRAARRDAEQVAFFSTAWAPPIPVIAELSSLFPTVILRLEYNEPLWGFHGFITLQAGEEIAAKHEEYVLEEESVRYTHGMQSLEEPGSVYVGRGRDADAAGPGAVPSRWANPFATDGRSHWAASRLYRRWVLGDPSVAAMLPPGQWSPPDSMDFRELIGKTLVCDCGATGIGDDVCHASTLCAIAFNKDDEDEDYSHDECDTPPR